MTYAIVAVLIAAAYYAGFKAHQRRCVRRYGRKQ